MANILIDAGHPAHVHLFRNAIHQWQTMGHDVFVSALDREMIIDLLKQYNLPYAVTYKRRAGRWNLWLELVARTLRTWQIAQQHKTDLFISMANPIVGLVAKMMNKPYLATTDTEPSYNQLHTAMPFITRLLTPDVFYRDEGDKQHRYAGYHELAYLHPDVYSPSDSIYEEIGLSKGTPFSILRFVAWNATHDMYEKGFSPDVRESIIRILRQYGEVIVSSEDPLPPHLKKDVITDYPTDKMSDLLAFAQLYVGEGNTMASEAAVSGTPSIRVNTMDLGYCRDLQARGLMFQLLDSDAIITKIHEILTMTDRETYFKQRRDTLLKDKVSPTDIFVEEALNLLDT